MSKSEPGTPDSFKELAHEIKTPLAAIRSNTDNLQTAFRQLRTTLAGGNDLEYADLWAIVEDSLRTNRLACDRLESLVRSAREREFVKADLHRIIENALTLLACQMKGRIELKKMFGDVDMIECHPGQLHQVFMNLLVNAVQAIKGPGEIRIETRQENATVHITISDDGPGISPEIISRIFDSEFTTKQPAGGSGLGLWICRRIIHDHGGEISAVSEPGQGATFHISLPSSHNAERTGNE